jgi:hypothetical protein
MSFIDHSDSPVSSRFHTGIARLESGGSQRATKIFVDPQNDILMGMPFAVDQTVSEFKKHKRKWLKDTRHLSSPIDRYMHPSYVRIIGLGAPVLKIILRDLKAEQNDWFYALRYIAGTDPVKPSMAGDIDQMTKAWIKWGEDHGFI